MKNNTSKSLLGFNSIEKGRQPGSTIQGRWSRPDVIRMDAENGYLLWDIKESIRTEPTPDERLKMLQDFIGLADIDTTDPRDLNKILRFAERWGVIGICKHELPAAHLSSDENLECSRCGFEQRATCLPIRGNSGYFLESVELWKKFAIKAKSVFHLVTRLSNAHHISRGRDIPDDVWETLVAWRDKYGIGKPDGKKIYRSEIALFITTWLEECGVRPLFSWNNTPLFTLSGPFYSGIMVPISVQSMLMVSGQTGFALCSECGTPFFLRPGQSTSPEGRNRYCKACGKDAARRLTLAKYRRNERLDPDRPKKKRLTSAQKTKIFEFCEKHKSKKQMKKTSQSKQQGFYKKLAEKYGVSESAIYKIAEGKIALT